VVEEMHLRRWPELSVPCTIFQFLRVVDESQREQELAAVLAHCTDSMDQINDAPRHLAGKLPGDVAFRWERHTEASSLTLFLEGEHAIEDIATKGLLPYHRALDWALNLPGQVLRATHIPVVADEMSAIGLVEQLDMVKSETISCHIAGSARFWSDFRIGPDGFGRLVISANGVAGLDLSRAVQRLQEVGNYRNLTLLGLPEAQSSWPMLSQIESRLNQLASDVVRTDATDDSLLERVSDISLQLIRLSTQTGFRMSATAAYARLIEERLAELNPLRIAGCLSLTDFTERRLLPAVRTCASHVGRTAELSARAERFAALLRTRIETRIENQNARLLQSMERSSELQLRLQQLVEGLSVVALSYYSLGLIENVLKWFEPHLPQRLGVDAVLAILTPVTVFVAILCMRRLRARIVHRA
jgi:uncharacterized membrane-anchored protein